MYKGLILFFITSFSLTALGAPQTICGPSDDRRLSFEPKVGRLFQGTNHRGCTVTMISEKCAVSAGHCYRTFENAEFNTPISQNGEPRPSDPRDTYRVDQDSIEYEDDGPGKDWAVLKLKENEVTGKLAGSIQGYYDISYQTPRRNLNVRITGYGRASDFPRKNFAQQTHLGKISRVGHLFFGLSTLGHTVDTMGGNSGSSIINEDTQEIIGIHTHGGCREDGGQNLGTILARNNKFIEAIRNCLEN